VDQVEAHGWSVRELEMQVKEALFEQRSSVGSGTTALPKGRLYTYPVVADEAGQTRLDLGLKILLGPTIVELDEVVPGDMTQSQRTVDTASVPFRARTVAADTHESFAYNAIVLRVIDGDTLVVMVDNRSLDSGRPQGAVILVRADANASGRYAAGFGPRRGSTKRGRRDRQFTVGRAPNAARVSSVD